jgi:hypothetical protein
MTGFLNVRKLIVPEVCILKVYEHIRKAGEKGVEGIALWAGETRPSEFEVRVTIIPKQTAYERDGGLLYVVEGDELHRINKWLYENKLSLMVQIHSHPGKAYHSATDDAYPVISTVGGISIVIPDFGFGNIDTKNWAVYRLIPGRGWAEQSRKEIDSLITITK